MKYILSLFILLFSITLNAGQYTGKYKYYELHKKYYEGDTIQQVKAINFGFTGAYANDEYIIKFEEKPKALLKRILKTMIENQKKVDKANKDLLDLKYDETKKREEKNIEKSIYINTINTFSDKVKIGGKALEQVYYQKPIYGIKFRGYIKRIYPKRGQLIKKGFPLFQYLNEKKARMKIKISEQDFTYIDLKRVAKNNIIISKDKYEVKRDKKTEEPYLYIYLDNPSDFEMNQKYTISIY